MQRNLFIMNQQQDITEFESLFNGTFPFTSDGVVVGTPAASFKEEMQTMITFAGGRIDPISYTMTFFKEGMATMAEYLLDARTAELAAGGPHSPRGQAAFEASLIQSFNQAYAQKGTFWTAAPSNPTPFGLFSFPATYGRPAAAYLALRQILGKNQLHPGAAADPA